MFQYEYEKHHQSSSSSSHDQSHWPSPHASLAKPKSKPLAKPPRALSVEYARRPLPPRPIVVEQMPTKTTVPLKVWVIASASCFAVSAALVLATVVITKWGSTEYTREVYAPQPDPIYSIPYKKQKPAESEVSSEETENEIQFPTLEKISLFKNIVASRDRKKKTENLATKSQIHPLHDPHHVDHGKRRIEKKDQAKYNSKSDVDENEIDDEKIPNFKPNLPDMILKRKELKLVDTSNFITPKIDYDEYYNDQNLYDDYLESNSMTSYLLEKVSELHDWIVSDPDFDYSNSTKRKSTGNEFGQVLKALNESLIEGNITIIMNKLKDIYFGENYTHANHTRKVILSNSTDLLSFGILTLDVMLLHNIQLMAWENQESAQIKMLKDPDVFAFNALFMDPAKVEAKHNEVYNPHDNYYSKRQNLRESIDDFDASKSLLENFMDIGMSTARAAIHLGRAYKSTKVFLNHLSSPNSNRDSINANIQVQISRNLNGNAHALHRLQTSFNNTNMPQINAANMTYTELDCVWLLYCRNLVLTAKLNAPYGTMARINGMALRMLTGELAPDRALDTMLYEVLTGWTELNCNEMFPRCSKADAAAVVMESIMAPLRKSQSSRTMA